MNPHPSRPVSRFFPIGGNVETDGNETGNESVSISQNVETAFSKSGNAEALKHPPFVSIRFQSSP